MLRSELVAIAREHTSFMPEGLRLRIPRSKINAAGQGRESGVPRGLCAGFTNAAYRRVRGTEDHEQSATAT
jgi:hypothetical protein